MRRLVLVLPVLAGCSKLFGLEHVGTAGDARDIDAPPDAHNVGIATLVETPMLVMAPLIASEPAEITTVVHGPGDTYVPFAMTTSNGAFGTVPGEVHIAPTGTADVAVQLTAAARGMVMVTATSGAHSATAGFNALEPVRIGPTVDATWGGGTYLPNTILGMQLVLPAMYLRALGITILSPSGNARLGLYADSGGHPGALIAQAGPLALATGDTSAPVTPIQLGAGNYWIVVISDGSLHVPVTTTSPVAEYTDTGDASMPLPATAPLETPLVMYRFPLFISGAN